MIWDRDTETVIRNYLTALGDDNAAAFVGAGLSREAGFANWVELLAPIAKDLGLDATREPDLVRLAQFHVNSNADNRNQLSQLLIDRFSDLPVPTENHAILARLPIATFWTTNYDRLMEKALEANGKRVDTKYTNKQLSTTRRGRDVAIYKMHGDIEHPQDAVLIRNDYEAYHLKHAAFVTALSGDLVSKTFLFLGFSFTDPNLDYILSRIRVHFDKDQRQHYCVMKRRLQMAGEAVADFEYAALRQELQVNDLMRFNIKTVLVDEYSHITELLKLIEGRFRRRTIFLSGSAADFAPWGQTASEEFLARLAGALIDQNFKLTTGFGIGVGGAIVGGALSKIYSVQNRKVEDHLVMRPFPAASSDPKHQDIFDRYRKELISQAGIAIFFMGNRADAGGPVDADGVRAEFNLARELGQFVIPIGSSGHMAKKLWDDVMADLASFFPEDTDQVRSLMQAIGKSVDDPLELLEPLLKLVALLTKD